MSLNCNRIKIIISYLIFLMAALKWRTCETGCLQCSYRSISSDIRNDDKIHLVGQLSSIGQENEFNGSDFLHISGSLHLENNETDELGFLKFHKKFHSFDRYKARILRISKSNPRLRVVSVGHSFEGRELFLVKISSNFNGNKPVIFIDGGHHAREWISISTAMYVLESLAHSHQSLERYDFWFLPIINPDGYEYSRKGNRLWRKNRSHFKGQRCFGVDLNRNYPVYWSEIGSSNNPCDDIYAGKAALSEPETRANAEVLIRNSKRIRMYISLHSFGQMILHPFGYTTESPFNRIEHEKIAEAWVRSVRRVHGTLYQCGSAGQMTGTSSGGSDDYAFLKARIRYSFTIELPPDPSQGRKGFLLPPEKIISIGKETVIGLLAMTKSLDD